MMGELRGEFHFPQESLLRNAACALGLQHLDGHLPRQTLVAGEADGAMPPLPSSPSMA